MKKYIAIFICLTLSCFNHLDAQITNAETGEGHYASACPGLSIPYKAFYAYVPDSDKIYWTITNGKFSSGGTSFNTDRFNNTVSVIWNDIADYGTLTYKTGGKYPFSDKVTIRINSVKDLSIPSISIDSYQVANNSITIPRGNSGSFVITIPELWVKTDWKDYIYFKITNYQWSIPKIFGGSGNWVEGTSKQTIRFDKANGDGATILIRPVSYCSASKVGKTYTLTIRRTGNAFNGIVENETISSTKSYEWPDLLVRNVAVLPTGNVNFIGNNSVNIESLFTAHQGSEVRIYCEPKIKEISTRSTESSLTDGLELSTITENKSQLFQNYPNPFTKNISIKYYINETEKKSDSFIIIHNILGNMVKKIIISHSGHGNCEFDTSEFTSGTYFYTLIVNHRKVDTKRMICVE